MAAFAANSILNRFALAGGAIGPASFAATRLTAGAVVLIVLLAAKGGLSGLRQRVDISAVAGLTAYMLGFSFAYRTLDAGLGALILFGGVQITMFLGAVLFGQRPGAGQWLGSCVAFGGLVWLLWPGATSPDATGTVLMAIAAVGWGVYSLAGQKTSAPLAATARNFALSVPFGLILWAVVPTESVSVTGIVLACLSGGVTSALGYALWYQLMPKLSVANAAVAQLSVPLIAMAGGMVFLAEAITPEFLIAAFFVLGGIVITVLSKKRNT